jgi:hypothetical protein
MKRTQLSEKFGLYTTCDFFSVCLHVEEEKFHQKLAMTQVEI